MRRDLDEARFNGVSIGLFIVRDRMPTFAADTPEPALPEEILHIIQVFCIIGWHLKSDIEMTERTQELVLKYVQQVQEVVRRVAKGEGRFLIFVGRG